MLSLSTKRKVFTKSTTAYYDANVEMALTQYEDDGSRTQGKLTFVTCDLWPVTPTIVTEYWSQEYKTKDFESHII